MGQDQLLVGCIYRSPSSDPVQSTSGLCNLFSEINEFSNLLVCGDFNYPDINWTLNPCNNHCSQLLLDAVQDKYHVEIPTRFVQNSTSNVVMINEEEMIDGINVLPALDHICLRFNYCSEGHVSKQRFMMNSLQDLLV